MKICLPVSGPEGLQAYLQPEFTIADHLLIFDLQSGDHYTVSRNSPQDTEQQGPIEIDAVLCSGMEGNLVNAFAMQGIRVFATSAETVAQAIEALNAGHIEPLMPEEGGGCGGGCGGSCSGEGHDHEHGEAGCCGGGGHDSAQGCGGGCGCHG